MLPGSPLLSSSSSLHEGQSEGPLSSTGDPVPLVLVAVQEEEDSSLLHTAFSVPRILMMENDRVRLAPSM